MDDYRPAAGKTIGIFAAIVFSQAVVNMLGQRVLGIFSLFSIVMQTAFVLTLGIAILAKAAPNFGYARWVFEKYNDGTEPYVNITILMGQGWVILIGALPAAFPLYGFDASAYLSEETRRPGRTAPRSMMLSYIVSAILGWGSMPRVVHGTADCMCPTIISHSVTALRGFSVRISRHCAVITSWTSWCTFSGVQGQRLSVGVVLCFVAGDAVYGGSPISLQWLSLS